MVAYRAIPTFCLMRSRSSGTCADRNSDGMKPMASFSSDDNVVYARPTVRNSAIVYQGSQRYRHELWIAVRRSDGILTVHLWVPPCDATRGRSARDDTSSEPQEGARPKRCCIAARGCSCGASAP